MCITTHYVCSVDKIKEWKMRLKRRTRRIEEIPFGLRDQAQAKVKEHDDGLYVYTSHHYAA